MHSDVLGSSANVASNVMAKLGASTVGASFVEDVFTPFSKTNERILAGMNVQVSGMSRVSFLPEIEEMQKVFDAVAGSFMSAEMGVLKQLADVSQAGLLDFTTNTLSKVRTESSFIGSAVDVIGSGLPAVAAESVVVSNAFDVAANINKAKLGASTVGASFVEDVFTPFSRASERVSAGMNVQVSGMSRVSFLPETEEMQKAFDAVAGSFMPAEMGIFKQLAEMPQVNFGAEGLSFQTANMRLFGSVGQAVSDFEQHVARATGQRLPDSVREALAEPGPSVTEMGLLVPARDRASMVVSAATVIWIAVVLYFMAPEKTKEYLAFLAFVTGCSGPTLWRWLYGQLVGRSSVGSWRQEWNLPILPLD